MTKLEYALKAARQTKALIIGNGVLPEIASLFSEQFPGRKAVTVADSNTYFVAGKDVDRYLADAGIPQLEPFIFKAHGLYAEYSFVEQLVSFLGDNDAIPIAVGSGTINDLTKLAAHLCHRPYMCVATAASMDGYTAYGASIMANGDKQTFSCPAPQVCLADIAIITEAPAKMTASGYADLFAKVTAGADWILADELGVEPINPRAWNIVQKGLPEALANPQKILQSDPECISALIRGLMLGGFAMQWTQSSRPASGAEHQFSHLWNMEHHTNGSKHVSHGFQVAIGTLAIAALYEQMLASPLDKLDVEYCLSMWPSVEELQRKVSVIFQGTDLADLAMRESLAKYIPLAELAVQLKLLKSRWPQIRRRLKAQLIPLEEIRHRLLLIGAPTDPEQIGISREHLRQTFIKAQCIRRRFTILDIALRACVFDTWLAGLFGSGAIWEIKNE